MRRTRVSAVRGPVSSRSTGEAPGTNPDLSCQTIGEVRVEVLNADPGLDIRRSIRVPGKCGSDQMRDIARMSEHVAAFIDYELRGREGRRPSTGC
jgi:hypothetical protein